MKCGETPFELGGGEEVRLLKIPWDSPCMTVLQKLFLTFMFSYLEILFFLFVLEYFTELFLLFIDDPN